MSIIVNGILVLLGVVLALFFYWKQLRDDYTQNQIFISGFTILAAAGFGSLLGVYLSPSLNSTSIFMKDGLWFWSGIIGFLIGFAVNQYRFKFRIFEAFEAASITLLIFSGFFIRDIRIFALFILLFGIYLYLHNNYRKFTWYRSGKVGFAAVLTWGVLFLVRAVVFILPISQHFSGYFIGKVDVVISLICAVTAFFVFYNLAQSK